METIDMILPHNRINNTMGLIFILGLVFSLILLVFVIDHAMAVSASKDDANFWGPIIVGIFFVLVVPTLYHSVAFIRLNLLCAGTRLLVDDKEIVVHGVYHIPFFTSIARFLANKPFLNSRLYNRTTSGSIHLIDIQEMEFSGTPREPNSCNAGFTITYEIPAWKLSAIWYGVNTIVIPIPKDSAKEMFEEIKKRWLAAKKRGHGARIEDRLFGS